MNKWNYQQAQRMISPIRVSIGAPDVPDTESHKKNAGRASDQDEGSVIAVADYGNRLGTLWLGAELICLTTAEILDLREKPLEPGVKRARWNLRMKPWLNLLPIKY